MPNGKGFPDCHNCKFYVSSEDKKYCGKHNFIIPTITFEKVCCDWESPESKAKKPYPSLTPGILYYYSYASNQVLEPLGSFEYFDRPIIFLTAYIYEDTEYGWAIYLPKDAYKYFPESGGQFSYQLNDAELAFGVADAMRLYHGGGKRNDKGEWGIRWSREKQRIIYCMSPPTLFINGWIAFLTWRRFFQNMVDYGKNISGQWVSLFL